MIRDLLEIRWRDWPSGKIEANLPAILGDDIAALRRAAEQTG